jgi:hypothetical protein
MAPRWPPPVLGDDQDPAWSPRERLLVALVDRLHDHATVDNALWRRLRRNWTEEQLLDLMLARLGSAGTGRCHRCAWTTLVLILGRNHLERILRGYVRHYNQHRPNRALGLQPSDQPAGLTVDAEDQQGRVSRLDLLGGRLHEYRRAA